MSDASRPARLFQVAEAVVRAGAAPGAAVAVVFPRGAERELAWASAGSAADRPGEPVFDLASVSKPFTAVTAARLARAGRLELAAPLGSLLEEARGTPSAAAPLLSLLAHRAGLEAHRPLFAPLLRGEPIDPRGALAEASGARRANVAGAWPREGFPPLYSDLGYLLAGVALERATGQPLDELMKQQVFDPLGLALGSARQWLVRTDEFLARVLPTETVPWRGGELAGVVHDENAWALAGHGASGHAGLFGTAPDVARFGATLLASLAGDRPDFLTPEELLPFVQERPGGTLRAGFDGVAPEGSSAGARASPKSFGHLGFTGTSLWCDPLASRATVLLSNRVCPTRDNLLIRAARPSAHDALWTYEASE